MFCSINTDSINSICFDYILDPIAHGSDDGRVFRVQVRKREFIIAQPTLLYVSLIVVVRDQTFRMKLGSRVERRKRGKISIVFTGGVESGKTGGYKSED